MVLILAFQSMIMLSSLTAAKPNCSRSCGNVSIPYPFGIGDGCYLDNWYAIDCTSGKPFLRNNRLEVLSISFEKSTMLVKHPAYNNCQNLSSSFMDSVNLTHSPFFFSRTENVLTGLGCDNFARLYSNGTVAACYSSCGLESESETKETTGCLGNKCCQTRISSTLQEFSAIVSYIKGNRERECKLAFLVQETWFTENLRRFYHANLKKEKKLSVPVVLNWGIEDDKFKELRNPDRIGDIVSCDVFANSTLKDASFAANRASSSGTSRNSPVLRCKCLSGFEGNPYLPQGCHDIDECNDKENNCGPDMNCRNLIGSFECYPRPKVIVIISGIATGFFCLLLLIGAWRGRILIKKRKDIKLKEKYFERNGGLLLQQRLTSSDGSVDRSKLFNSKELDKATDHFNLNRILGQGGQGTIYKGMLTDGKIIAVKKSKAIDEGQIGEFINEVAILSQINHRNVVKLLGCCLETEVPLLVYEFIPNGTLFQYLHDQTEELPLTWEMRLQIATEVAGALFYLHSAASFPIYHRDIKSANILLDDKYRAKVADFGLSKSLAIDQTHVTTKVQGTFGYLDPEYFQSSQFTDKSDVYSFGVVLVELLTGQKPISSLRLQDNRSLATHFIVSMQKNNLFDILDPEVMKGKKEDIMTTAELAKRCLNLNGKKRPTMREVAMTLQGIQASQKHSNVVSTPTCSTFEEVEYVRTELIEPWDVVSNSTSSTFELLFRQKVPNHC